MLVCPHRGFQLCFTEPLPKGNSVSCWGSGSWDEFLLMLEEGSLEMVAACEPRLPLMSRM